MQTLWHISIVMQDDFHAPYNGLLHRRMTKEDYYKRKKAFDRIYWYLKKKYPYPEKVISFRIGFEKLLTEEEKRQHEARSKAARKAALTSLQNKSKKLEKRYAQTLFPDYLLNTDPKYNNLQRRIRKKTQTLKNDGII